MKKQILMADNDPDFLNTRAEFIRADYQVLKAYTLEDARQLLANAHFHIAILDIRMVNDDDETDISGLTLAKDAAHQAIPKIILTGFPTVQAVREALGAALHGLPPAVDFIAKADGPESMLQAIDKAFAQFVHINWNLGILWDSRNPMSFPHLISLLLPNLPNDILVYRANELEDLIRRLFYQSQQVRFGRLLWYDQARFCLSVLTQSSDGATDLRILVCGERKLLALERAQKERLSPEALQSTELRGQAETTHFGANIYGLPGVDIETVQTLRDLLQIGKERPIKTAFGHLLGNVLKEWHNHGQKVEGHQDLMSLYRKWAGLADDQLPQLEQRLNALIQSVQILGTIEIRREDQKITFRSPHQPPRSFPDPLMVAYSPLPQYNDVSVICRVSPGRLKIENILVDSEQKTWLTDFASAGQAPQWWDFICLEAALRFETTQVPDFMAWQDFEECLMKPSQLDEHLEQNDVISELRTNTALIEQIRQQAASEAGPNLIPYHAGLLMWVVESISHYDPTLLSTKADRLRDAHLLLAACLLAEQLNTGVITDDSRSSGELHLSDDDRLLIGGRQIATFTGLRLKLFRCLYDQAGQLVTTRSIVEQVYGEKYDSMDRDQNQRIRQEISRLRDAIEPKPNHPRYILTVREKGYRLQLNGELER